MLPLFATAVVQVHSEAATVHAPRVPRSLRDALMKQALPPGQEHVLYGHHSPGPAIMGQTSSMGRQLVGSMRLTAFLCAMLSKLKQP